MSSKQKYALVMPDTGRNPLEKDEVKKVIHIPPPKVLDKEVAPSINTVHPLEAQTAEFDAVSRNNKYKTKPVVKAGVNFLRWLYILALPVLINLIFTSTSFLDFISLSVITVVVYYYQFAYLNKIHKSKNNSFLRFIRPTFDFELIVMLVLIVISVFIFTIN